MSNPLVLPMLIQMGLTLLVLYALAYGRLTSIKKAGGVGKLVKAGGFKPKIVNRGDNFKNQFELPVIFYGLCLLFIVTDTQNEIIIWSAWIFVVARILHAAVQLTNNIIFPNRFLAFFVSALALTVMFIVALLQAVS